MAIERVAIVVAVRTAVGRFGGALRDVPAASLAAAVLREAVKRSRLDPGQLDEVILGHVLVNGETPNISRMAVLEAGFPVEVPAYTLDRQCGSGLQAVINGAMQIQTGNAGVVLAGGVESESNAEFYVTGARWGLRLGTAELKDRIRGTDEMVSCQSPFGPIPGMIHTAENVAEKYGISREDQDRFALRSHQKAVAAMRARYFAEEITPVEAPAAKGQKVIVDTDEHPRPETTLEALAKLPPVLGKTVTAGNASGINDGAAVCMLMRESRARSLGLAPLGFVGPWAVAGCHPAVMGIGPVHAVRKLLAMTGRKLDDAELIEINEAFAAQALAVLKELGVRDFEKVNVNGSGISLGHPLGATGARILVSLLYEMKRRGARLALETMCIGGGMGLAAFVERD